jgi:hypothetical protein
MSVIRASHHPPPAAARHGTGSGQRHNQVVNKARVDNKPTAKLKRLFRKQLSALYSLLRASFFLCSIYDRRYLCPVKSFQPAFLYKYVRATLLALLKHSFMTTAKCPAS